MESMADTHQPSEFQIFLSGLASNALLYLGEIPDPETNHPRINLTLAQQTIDILSMLRDKTQGNLTVEEDELFERLLYDLRVRFVNRSQSDKKD
jgi:hypothetical protein